MTIPILLVLYYVCVLYIPTSSSTRYLVPESVKMRHRLVRRRRRLFFPPAPNRAYLYALNAPRRQNGARVVKKKRKAQAAKRGRDGGNEKGEREHIEARAMFLVLLVLVLELELVALLKSRSPSNLIFSPARARLRRALNTRWGRKKKAIPFRGINFLLLCRCHTRTNPLRIPCGSPQDPPEVRTYYSRDPQGIRRGFGLVRHQH